MSEPILDHEKLKYPIGKFVCPAEITHQQLQEWQNTIAAFPEQLAALLQTLTPQQADWQYRPDGWTIKQVVHHLADSHMNAIIRLKLALTENVPAIKPYEEALWADLPDSLTTDLASSLKIIEGVHARWSYLLTRLSENQWNRMYFHPQHQRLFSVKEGLGLYAWHCNHHLAHIKQAFLHKGEFAHLKK